MYHAAAIGVGGAGRSADISWIVRLEDLDLGFLLVFLL